MINYILNGFKVEMEKIAVGDDLVMQQTGKCFPTDREGKWRFIGKKPIKKEAAISPKVIGGLELAGLAALATPSVHDVFSKKKTSHRTSRLAELSGLGALGTATILHMKR